MKKSTSTNYGAELSSVYWIGGSFSGGKSTTCRILAKGFGLQPFHYDRYILQNPEFQKFRINEPWFWAPNDSKLEQYHQAWPTAVAHIAEIAKAGPVVVEGPGVLPNLLADLRIPRSNAIFLVPTPAHQRLANRTRGSWVDEVLSDADDPEGAWEQWMRLDEEFAVLISKLADRHSYRVQWNMARGRRNRSQN